MKHAYLIMAHNEPYILERLLKLIDDKRNDIFIHIDKKWDDFDFEYFQNVVKESSLYFTKRLDVKWGSKKQIDCEMLLFKTAKEKGTYAYYHLLSGTDLPLKTQDEMHAFFDKDPHTEYVIFDNHEDISEDALKRIKYYHFLVSWARSDNKFKRWFFGKFHFQSLKIMRKIKINRLKKYSLNFRKGANWVSLTDEFVSYVLTKEKLINEIFKYSYCADELFVQTILYNSPYYKNVCSKKNDDYQSLKRLIDWNRGQPYTFKSEDYDLLINSDCFFARKFSVKVDKDIIDKIFEKGMKECGKS